MAIPITIQGCGSVSGASFYCGGILAVNGFDCTVQNITDGCVYNTKRPYGFLSSYGNCIIATQSNCGNRLFILDKCLNEIGSICLPEVGGPLLTAHVLCDGKLLLSYRKRIVLANSDGSTAKTVAEINCADTDFIAAFPNNQGLLIAYNDGYRDAIQYRSCNGNISKCILPPCVRVKSFTAAEDGTVYGLFSKGYPYGYLIPVLVDNALNCVSEECFGINLLCL